MDETTPDQSETPTRTPVPDQIGAITGLGGFGAIGILIGLVMIMFVFGIGDSTNLSVADLAGRIVLASLAGVVITAGFLAVIATGMLVGIREMLRRHQDGKPL